MKQSTRREPGRRQAAHNLA